MKEITAVKINPTDFAPFGTYCSMTEPKGYPLQGEIHKFYPDRISGTCMGSMGFSPISVRKDERIVKMAEYHTTTWEGIVALDDDMIIHVAPASAGTPVPELTKAFLVPKGCMVKINAFFACSLISFVLLFFIIIILLCSETAGRDSDASRPDILQHHFAVFTFCSIKPCQLFPI